VQIKDRTEHKNLNDKIILLGGGLCPSSNCLKKQADEEARSFSILGKEAPNPVDPLD